MPIKPILFNTDMVRAILDGRKSCTRRICKDANEYTVPDMEFYNADRRTYAVYNFVDKEHMEQLSTAERTCPICTGDILYVRETWKEAPNGYYYYEDWQRNDIADITKWKPSIHMPKEAARIWLKVMNVRVERLQDITSEQIGREGVEVEYPHVLNGEEKDMRFRLFGTTPSRNPTLTATVGMQIRGCGLSNLSGVKNRRK